MVRYTVRKARENPDAVPWILGPLIAFAMFTPIGLPIILGAAGVAAAADIGAEAVKAAQASAARRRQAEENAERERKRQLALAEAERQRKEADAEEKRKREEEIRTKPARDAERAARIRAEFRRRVALVVDSELEPEDKEALINELRDKLERKLRELVA